MNPSSIDKSIMNQEVQRFHAIVTDLARSQNQSVHYATVESFDPVFNVWNVRVGSAIVKASTLSNTAIAPGQVVPYFKAYNQNTGYIKTNYRT
jgi:hypothetical protein